MLEDIKLRHAEASGEVWIVPAVQDLILGFRQTGFTSKEAGGILLGYRRGPHVEVLEASAPLPGDKRGRHNFERRDPGHQALNDARWKASNGTVTYVGEWHSHPERSPSPSPTDQSEWRKLKAFYREPLVFLIIGTENWYVEFQNVRWVIVAPKVGVCHNSACSQLG